MNAGTGGLSEMVTRSERFHLGSITLIAIIITSIQLQHFMSSSPTGVDSTQALRARLL